MLEDPVLFSLTALMLVLIPIVSYHLGKAKRKRYFTLPLFAMGLAFTLFLLLFIVV